MSDDKKETKEEAPAKKSGGGKLGMIVIAVLVCVCSTGGAVAGQVAMSRMKPAEKPKTDAGASEKGDKEEEEEKEEAAGETITIESLIVDLRSANGELHHIKVGLAVELKKPIKEEEQKKLIVRAKDAAISYLRTLAYDEVTNPEKFEAIKKEVGERVSKAMGRGRVAHVLFTEFVVQ